MFIEDGKGNGVLASVSPEKRLRTEAISWSPQLHASLVYQQAYQVISGVRNIATAGAYGLLAIKNDGDDDLAVTYIRVGVDRIETAQMKVELLRGGTWVDEGTTANIYNMNARSTLVPNLTARYGNTPTGADIPDAKWIKGPDEVVWRKEGSLVLPTGGIVALRVTTETNAVNVHGRISFFVIPREVSLDLRS